MTEHSADLAWTSSIIKIICSRACPAPAGARNAAAGPGRFESVDSRVSCRLFHHEQGCKPRSRTSEGITAQRPRPCTAKGLPQDIKKKLGLLPV